MKARSNIRSLLPDILRQTRVNIYIFFYTLFYHTNIPQNIYIYIDNTFVLFLCLFLLIFSSLLFTRLKNKDASPNETLNTRVSTSLSYFSLLFFFYILCAYIPLLQLLLRL